MSRLIRMLPTGVKDYLSKNPISNYVYSKTVLRSRQQRGRPIGITIELTDRCNLRCSYCPKSKGIGGKGGDMDFDLFKKIVDDANRFTKIEQMPLVGFGEPLLYPHLIEAIRYVKEKYPYTELVITTNATLLNEEIGLELIDSGLDSLNISVNTHSVEKYKQLNNADKFNTVVSNTHRFLRMLNKDNVKRKPMTFVQILETVNTPEEIESFSTYWRPYLKPNARLKYHPMCNWGGQVEVKGYSIKRKERYPCDQLHGSLIITREGNAIPCCMVLPLEAGDLILGNVKDYTIEELFTKGKILGLRKKDLAGRINEVNPCSTCDAWQISPNAWFKNPITGVWF